MMLALRELALDRLRRTTGDLYDLSLDYFRVDSDHAVVSFVAASMDAQVPLAIETVDDAISELADQGIPQDVYERIAGRLTVADPAQTDLARSEMIGHAYSESVGWDLDSLDERRDGSIPPVNLFPSLAMPLKESLHVLSPESVESDHTRFPLAQYEPIEAENVADWTGGADNSWPGPGSRILFGKHALFVDIPAQPGILIPFDEIVGVIVNKRHEFWLLAEDGSEFRFWRGDWQPRQDQFWNQLWRLIPWDRSISGFDEPITPTPSLLRTDRSH